jgi:hypothetical protein
MIEYPLIILQALDTRTPLVRVSSAAVRKVDGARLIHGLVVLDATPSLVTVTSTRLVKIRCNEGVLGCRCSVCYICAKGW